MTPDLTARRRAHDLEHLAAGEQVDVLVIGGGITGTGIALDAASRGLSVALVERRDLATGTSRWSSKLIHGGLRYLANGDVAIAYESARERDLLLTRLAPHLVRPLPMLLPFGVGEDRRTDLLNEVGVRLGDVLRMAAGTSRRDLPRPRRTTAHEAVRWVPSLASSGLRGGVLYWDGQLEDDARLVVAVARTAAAHGARLLTYVAALSVDRNGAVVRDEMVGHSFRINARRVVNATGVWAGELVPSLRLRPSRGAHLVVRSGSLGWPRAAFNVPVPGHSARFVFALPQPDGLTYIGLTDDPTDEPPSDAPGVTAAEEEFLLDTLSRALATPLTAADVVGRFAGLRPLLDDGRTGATADLSRRHAIVDVDGVLSVVGGKLTTYRRMAQDTVDRISDLPCRTAHLPLVGAASRPALAELVAAGVPRRLVRRYGAEAPAVLACAREDPGLLEPLADGVPVLGVEVRWALTHEGARTLEDVLDRRTRLGLVPQWRRAAESRARDILAASGAQV